MSRYKLIFVDYGCCFTYRALNVIRGTFASYLPRRDTISIVKNTHRQFVSDMTISPMFHFGKKIDFIYQINRILFALTQKNFYLLKRFNLD